MQSAYRTVRAAAGDEFIERKSRFIGSVCPVHTEAEALAFLESIRSQYRDATHNCFAYILRENHLQRFSDDGEPQGTAGRPILDLLLHEQLTDLCVVVTRYFGGILLGTGGLTRAYSRGCKCAVEAGGILAMFPSAEVLVETDYSFYGKLQNLTPGFGAIVLSTDFGAGVSQRLMLRADRFSAFAHALTENSAGAVSPQVLSENFYPFPDE